MAIKEYDEKNSQTHETVDAMPVEEAPKPKKSGNKKLWGWIVFLIIMLILVATCPKEEDHKFALNGDVSTAVTKSIVGENSAWALLGNLIVSKLVDATIDNNVKYSNYLVCSTTTARYEGQSSILTIGVFNHVFVLFDKNDLQQIVEKEVNNVWQGIMGAGSILNFGNDAQEENKPAKNDIEPLDENDTTAIVQQPSKPQPKSEADKTIEEKITEKVEQALEKGVSNAIDGFLKGILGE